MTDSGAGPLVLLLLTKSLATGGAFTLTGTEAVPVAPLLSVTVRTAV